MEKVYVPVMPKSDVGFPVGLCSCGQAARANSAAAIISPITIFLFFIFCSFLSHDKRMKRINCDFTANYADFSG
jgi:hypothetical protein